VVVTTHLEPLKGYGYLTRGVVNVGVEFDPDTLEPMYRLIYGTSAESHAFLVAEKMGISRDILGRAREYQQKAEGATGGLIQRLEALQAEAQAEKDRLRKLHHEVLEKKERLDGVIRRIQERRDRILLRVEERGQALIRETERQLGGLLQSLTSAEPGRKKPRRELREIQGRFRSRLRRSKKRRKRIENLQPGEWVRVLDIRKQGIVSQIQETIKSRHPLTIWSV
jgi:DNA mismatch repair protein MutS2